jgi:hypothetical protein
MNKERLRLGIRVKGGVTCLIQLKLRKLRENF